MAGRTRIEPPRGRAGFLVFAAIIIAAPLLFGAVDRFVQGALLGVFVLGLLIAPPVWPRFGRGSAMLLAALAAFFVAKEFVPAGWFGIPGWRSVLTGSFGVELPWTHNPEPIRAMEALLACAVGVVWFLWVRTLAADTTGARNLTWAMVTAGFIVAVVSLSVGQVADGAILGIRDMPGYKGFGPFPNRNHTADFLAMSAVLGFGCVVRDARVRRYLRAAVAALFTGVVLYAIFESRSRGGLVAVTVGFAALGAMLIARSPNRKVVASVSAAALIGVSLVFILGGTVVERFMTPGEGSIAENLRWQVWGDTVRMWKDAPIFGHGLSTFQHVFPMYQSIFTGNILVLHPESSWLQWLAEAGALGVLAVVALAVWMVVASFRRPGDREHAFHLRAAGLAAVVVILFHGLFDVPAHRWATAAFALAALALACPANPGETRRRRLALVPLVVAMLWLAPFFWSIPVWSSATLARVMSWNFTSRQAGAETLETLGRFFPLDADLQMARGVRRLESSGNLADVWRHFRIATRLKPASWLMPMSQAAVARRYSPQMALHFWTVAIERAGHRSEEFFFTAWQQTKDLPMAPTFWERYAANHPELLLTYARIAPPGDAAGFFRQWWNARAASTDLRPFEAENFLQAVATSGRKEDLLEWMKLHPERAGADSTRWAELLRDWGDDERAWELLVARFPEPGYPEAGSGRLIADLETEWRKSPENFVQAQLLATALHRRREEAMRDRVIMLTAEQEGAPEWFLGKAAYVHYRAGDQKAAVATLLRIGEGG